MRLKWDRSFREPGFIQLLFMVMLKASFSFPGGTCVLGRPVELSGLCQEDIVDRHISGHLRIALK